MKLSQKLLGLAGLAMADYACCPYDDYGLPDSDCTTALPEKTPFDSSPTWYNNACKAWEVNIDATHEGNALGGCADDNWGGCGFQRHFKWGQAASADLSTSILTGFTIQNTNEFDDTVVAPAINPFLEDYSAAHAGGNTARVFGGGDLEFTIGGLPFLGGICKLFVPVHQQYIDQVSIAGVHVSGTTISQYKGQMAASDGGAPATTATMDGTLYCFSVVNIQEFKTNTNDVANGNVAGNSGNVHGNGDNTDFNEDIFKDKNSLERQAGIDIGSFGDAAVVSGGGGMQAVGNNFDVVAHFNSAWCTENAASKIVDMQMSPDVNHGTDDYEFDHESGTFTHAHTDVLDKRHNKVGYSTIGKYSQDSGNAGYLENNLRWPNMGAWAAYYSVVSCTSTYQAGTDGYDIAGAATAAVVHSVSSNDFRTDEGNPADCTTKWATYRFNVRQVGSNVEICGPGQLPDTGSKRCTWNWNYEASATFGPGTDTDTDPEGFFDRNDNMAISVWSRKRRDAVARNDAANSVAPVLNNVTIGMTFKDQNNVAIAGANMNDVVVDNYGVSAITVAGSTITLGCDAGTIPAGGNHRDAFPTCFTGDEIHASVAYSPQGGTRGRISPWFTLASYASAP